MKDKTIVQFIWKFSKKYKWAFLLSYIALLGELAFNQLLPIFLGKVVNSAVYDANKRAFLFSTLLYALVFIGYKASGFTQLQIWQRINNKYVYDKTMKNHPRKIAKGGLIDTHNNRLMLF